MAAVIVLNIPVPAVVTPDVPTQLIFSVSAFPNWLVPVKATVPDVTVPFAQVIVKSAVLG